ncbi:NUDIX hydrolase [Paenibacillus paridis]|uniref:NUDIX hydrolase n=1 Tax=Paenibacillus paridis TaxID=2583376 RepID=UPI001122BA97|nr:NUDIX hydrolase [Paenibacillus paridis]
MAMPTHIVAAGGIVEDGHGNILLVKTEHDGWVFPGGQVEAGEDLMEALVREVQEESGIEVVVSLLIGVYSNTGVYKWHDGVTDVPTKVMLDFICQPIGGSLAISEETSEVRWVDRDEVLEFITSEAIRNRYGAYLDFTGSVHYRAYVTKPSFEISVQRTI